MATVLNQLYQFPQKYTSWKGRTLNQITSSVQKNRTATTSTIGKQTIFRALPLKIYRREHAANINSDAGHCTSFRSSSRIDEYMRPGGYEITESHPLGLVNTIETPTPPIKQTSYGCSGSADSVNCAATNARRRCRSSGMIRKTYDPARNDSSYFTNTNQYLVSRSKTFTQNQYKQLRTPDASVITTPIDSPNFFVANGISHCAKAKIGPGAQFKYYWIDAAGGSPTAYTVQVPSGFYDVGQLNAVLISAMNANHHYFINKMTKTQTYLMQIIFNMTAKCVELQAYPSNMVADANVYSIPLLATWTMPTSSTVPVFVFEANNPINSVVGFSAGQYPHLSDHLRTNAYGVFANTVGTIHPIFSQTTYKPSNSRFATQGAVSSGDMVVRRKYETISRNGAAYTQSFGQNVGNAMSYGVSDSVYTIKDKLGAPLRKTPVVGSNGIMENKCNTHIFSG